MPPGGLGGRETPTLVSFASRGVDWAGEAAESCVLILVGGDSSLWADHGGGRGVGPGSTCPSMWLPGPADLGQVAST